MLVDVTEILLCAEGARHRKGWGNRMTAVVRQNPAGCGINDIADVAWDAPRIQRGPSHSPMFAS